ncbi:hypothetical protein ACHAXS_001808 [Conticribra weissflogii]
MDWESLHIIMQRIEGHNVFQKQTNAGLFQVPLMILLNHLGTESSNDNRQRNVFFLGRGTSCIYCDQCVKVLIALCNEYVKWPDEEEKNEISEIVMNKFNIPNCGEIMFGTLLELGLKL